jgi:1,4-alpha-glucan branching enzyme
MTVGLSGAMPDLADLTAHRWSELDIRTTVVYLVEGILKRGGRIIHGNHPTYRPLIEATAGAEPGLWPDVKPVRMLVVAPYLKHGEADRLVAAHAGYADIEMVGPPPEQWALAGDAAAAEVAGPLRKASLQKMREQMAGEADALVCVGGKGPRPGITPGVQVEAALVAARQKPVYVASALGGFARRVYETGALPEANKSNNGLTPAENEQLAAEGDPAEVARLVLKGLEAHWRKRGGGGVRRRSSTNNVGENLTMIPVKFTYNTGLADPVAPAAVLTGSWGPGGEWPAVAMTPTRGADGCPAFTATVEFDPGRVGQAFRWGVRFRDANGTDGPWAVVTEDRDSAERVRSFTLDAPAAADAADAPPQHEEYFLTQARRLGAQKHHRDPASPTARPGIRFSTWAPNATAVEVCMAKLWDRNDQQRNPVVDPNRPQHPVPRAVQSLTRGDMAGGYIADGTGAGTLAGWGPFAMTRAPDGVWATDPADPALADYALFDHAPYMFKVTKDDGTVAYRTDLYSRCQIGYGSTVPNGEFLGPTTELDGLASCSVVVDPDLVTTEFLEPLWPETKWDPQQQFFDQPGARLGRIDPQDLIIYELHIGALGGDAVAGGMRPADQPGNLADAVNLLDHLTDLGVNAVELLPLSEFGGGGQNWGYATSHYYAIEYSGGGRDNYKHFIRQCHQKGMAVILDVVYNHYDHHAERAEWMYDTNRHEANAYYWYEGRPTDYSEFDARVEPGRRGQGGYVDNDSTAWAPRYWEEQVRAMFVGSALALAAEFHIDGFRVDQTTSIHEYNHAHNENVLQRPRKRLDHVNAFGRKLLRELTRAVKLVRPNVVLMAEDHSNNAFVTESPDRGGLGFDAVWYADFYHHLVGDTDKGDDYAKLIKTAGFGDDRPLKMDYFAGALGATGSGKVVYHESHDEAGNGHLTHRTIVVAVDGAPLFGATRRFAEARCRFAAAMTLLSAGIPLFLFGEEVGAERDFKYNEVLKNREDLFALRMGSGRFLFRYYQDLIRLRRDHAGLRSRDIEVVFVHNDHRLIGFRRRGGGEDFLVFGSLNNRPFNSTGYTFNDTRIPAGRWREVFNGDAADYGGDNVGNAGATVDTPGGTFACVVPANGVIVFQRVG